MVVHDKVMEAYHEKNIESAIAALFLSHRFGISIQICFCDFACCMLVLGQGFKVFKQDTAK